MTPGLADRIAALALSGVEREFPNKLAHLMLSADDALRTPSQLTPAFYGCFDWHSAVHSHWTLTVLASRFPSAPWVAEVRRVLTKHITPENIAAEVAYIAPRPGFECPYGLAWLLLLAVALDAWPDPAAQAASAAIKPLESLALDRMLGWLQRLPKPVRSGEHSQSAFGMSLLREWAETRHRTDVLTLVDALAIAFHGQDHSAPFHFEPSGYDFLSPSLEVAALMARSLDQPRFVAWLSAFWPALQSADVCLEVAQCPDRSDGKLAHLDGLNLSRARALQTILRALPQSHAACASLSALAAAHLAAGLAALETPHYEGTHWLGSFGVRAVLG